MGRLGLDQNVRIYVVPKRVPLDVPIAHVSCGTWSTCAMDVDGQAWCWGMDHVGQAGTYRHLPAFVPDGEAELGGVQP